MGEKLAPFPWRAGREEQADPSRGVGGRFSQQRNLGGLPWAAARQRSLLNRQPESFKVYIEAVTGVRHVPNPGSLSSTFLSQGCVLGQRLVPGRQVEHIFHVQGRDWEPPAAQVQLLGQTGDDLPNRPFAFHCCYLLYISFVIS